MGITAKNTGGNFELVPAGNHIARCYSMIEIGTIHDETYNVDRKVVRISWELPNERKVFNPEKGEQPFSIHKKYTLSLSEKANLRKDLESWRGKGFTEKEAEKFDITKLLGVTCMLNVIHKAAANGNLYANVVGISPIPKGIECPPQHNETFILSYEDWDQKKFEGLPDWLKKEIEQSKEYKLISSGGMESDEKTDDTNIGSDDLPF